LIVVPAGRETNVAPSSNDTNAAAVPLLAKETDQVGNPILPSTPDATIITGVTFWVN